MQNYGNSRPSLLGELEVGIQQLMKANSLDDIGKQGWRKNRDSFLSGGVSETYGGREKLRGDLGMRRTLKCNEWIAIYGSREVWIDANQARVLDAQIKALKMTLTSRGAVSAQRLKEINEDEMKGR